MAHEEQFDIFIVGGVSASWPRFGFYIQRAAIFRTPGSLRLSLHFPLFSPFSRPTPCAADEMLSCDSVRKFAQ